MHDEAPAPAPKKKMIGICAAIGEDIGFNPDILRILFAFALIWQPEATLIAYATAGALVLVSRLATEPHRLFGRGRARLARANRANSARAARLVLARP